jgi:hypothetical protein
MGKPISIAVLTYITRGEGKMPFTPYWLAEDHDAVGWGLTKDGALADLAARTGRRYHYDDEKPFSAVDRDESKGPRLNSDGRVHVRPDRRPEK